MTMHTLPADVIRNPMIRLVPLKGARESGEGRLIMLAPASARALAIYLRARRGHPLADSDWVWLGTRGRGRGRFGNTGIRKMLIRRAEQAGYEDVTPHQFRHTFSDAWLKSGGSEGDLMRLNGWKSRQMVDRYADDVANQRALKPSDGAATCTDPIAAHEPLGRFSRCVHGAPLGRARNRQDRPVCASALRSGAFRDRREAPCRPDAGLARDIRKENADDR